MTDVPSLATLRQVFALVFPMRGVVVVGAGRGQGLEDFRSAASVLLVDARRECIEPLQKQCVALPNATAVQAVIAARSGAVAFHFASKPDESALITPESLQPLWRNLTTNSMDEVEAVTLPDLLASLAPEPDFRCNWLVIDCLPALSVLEGARGLVDDVDVIELRCVRDGAVAVEGGVGLESAEQWLEARGFHLAAQFEETLPQLCKAVFCCDVSKLGAKVGDLENDLAQLKRGSEEHLRLLSAESEAKSAAEKLATDLQTQLDALSTENAALKAARDAALKEKAALAAARDAALKEKDALTSARDAALKERDDLTAERDVLANAKAAAEKLAAARQVQLDALNKEKAATKKASGDADIDDMISDLKPFFSGRHITYVDVGAYVGDVLVKILDSKGIKVREAHLYEPNPSSFEKLRANLSECRISSMHLYDFAISNTPGKKNFSAAASMTKMLQVDLEGELTTGSFTAESRALDDLATTYTDGHIDFLKIDVEGSELDVLESAKNLLREQRIDVIYIEAGLNRLGTQQTYLGDIDALLQDAGYRIFRIYEQKNEWMHDSPLLRRCNCAYMSLRFAEANPLQKTHELIQLRNEVLSLRKQLSDK